MGDATIDLDPVYVKKMMLKTGLPKPLSIQEKKYLLAVERGDMANVRRMLQKAHQQRSLNIDCVDSLGRGSLTLAIDGENLEMVELLIIMGVQTKDALLHAINAEFVEAVELLLEHEELIHKEGEPYSWQMVDMSIATFTPDITPLVLAAHRNNYEILKILLDRGASIPMPHDVKCGCDDCIRLSSEDSLRHSQSRLNEYKALASASLIALSSGDPLLTAFQLSWELRCLAFAEPECKAEYLELRRQCQQLAVDLLQQARTSEELAVILNHDPDSLPYEDGDHMKLARLEKAIVYKQKRFVAHPNIQQLLAALWYEGVPGFRRKSNVQKIMTLVQTASLFPLYCTLYMIAPNTKTGKLMRKPFMKFLIHASSYLFFLFILILVSQRVEDLLIEFFGTDSMKAERFIKQRGKPPAILEYVVLLYVIGHVYEETYEMIAEGFQSYLRNLWNIIDFARNSLYIMVFLLRVLAYIQQRNEIMNDPSRAYIPREQWNAFDPQLIAEGLFAAANIFSALKLVNLFSVNPHLGPLQISLGRMVNDIVKFFFIYSLVLFAFACGLNQLLWYFADLERRKCYKLPNGEPDWENSGDSCLKWRCFANVFESSQSLFWASFGMVELANFELTGIKTYTRFWGLLMFGSYSVINVIVLLNLLIAMMSNSYAMIEQHSDTEWKFARTKLWMSYFEEGNTLPPPFNIFPTMKTFMKIFKLRAKDKQKRMSTKRRNKEERERDYRYMSVIRALVWRYISAMHKKSEENPVTEDDINELKNDVSAFRFDILEVLNKNGMDISSVEKGDKTVLGKKMKVWERRLMKDFKVGPVVSEDEEDELLMYQEPPENEDPLSKFRRIAKLAVINSNLHKWGQVVKGAYLASQIGHCNTSDAIKKQQVLLKAMEEAQKYKDHGPVSISRSMSPTLTGLPDTTGESMLELINDIKVGDRRTPTPMILLSPATPKVVPKFPTQLIGQSAVDEDKIEEVDDFIDLKSTPSSPEMKPVSSFGQQIEKTEDTLVDISSVTVEDQPEAAPSSSPESAAEDPPDVAPPSSSESAEEQPEAAPSSSPESAEKQPETAPSSSPESAEDQPEAAPSSSSDSAAEDQPEAAPSSSLESAAEKQEITPPTPTSPKPRKDSDTTSSPSSQSTKDEDATTSGTKSDGATPSTLKPEIPGDKSRNSSPSASPRFNRPSKVTKTPKTGWL